MIRERGVAVAQAARNLDVHENVLHKWVSQYGRADRGIALRHRFYGRGLGLIQVDYSEVNNPSGLE